MSTKLTIPKLEMSMTEAMLAEWLVDDGARVAEGQPIYAIETDKATQEIESAASGVLTRKVVAGEVYPVGTEVAEVA